MSRSAGERDADHERAQRREGREGAENGEPGCGWSPAGEGRR